MGLCNKATSKDRGQGVVKKKSEWMDSFQRDIA